MLYRSHTYRGAKSGCEMVTLFGSDCDDGVSAGINMGHTYRCQINTEAHLCSMNIAGMISFWGLLSE